MENASSGIVQKLLAITLLGSEWVLWLLIALSILSIAVMIERTLFFQRTGLDHFKEFLEKLSLALRNQGWDDALTLCQKSPSLETSVAIAALENRSMGPNAVQKLTDSRITQARQDWDRGLMILGTLGNNTPFIGLFGTVIGIIQSFHALSLNPTGGSAVVMSGISEALIATAVGLMVAIPAVIAFNVFQRIVKSRMANALAIQELILSHLLRKDC